MTSPSKKHHAGDLLFLKRLNRSAILNLVRRSPGMTRADIATQAHLTKATVGGSIQKLLEAGWIVEGELQKSSGGRPGRALYLDDQYHTLLGAEVGVHELRLVACSLTGRIIQQRQLRLTPTTPEVTAALLAEQLHELASHPDIACRQCLGLGVAVPGPIAPSRPLLRLAPNLGWQDVPFLELLRPHLPALSGLWLMDNEAKAAAFGELYFRTGNVPSSLAYISAGTGIGSGFVENAHAPLVTRGIQGLAGEIGHTILQPDGMYCHCGNRGCAETLVSGWAIRATLGIGEEENLAEALRTRQQDPKVKTTLRQAGGALGTLLLNLHHTLNPSEIVLGGSLVQLGAPLLAPALDYFETNQNRLRGTMDQVRLRVLDDSTFVTARGAAAQVLAEAVQGFIDTP
ncbi:ROK family protein [Kushneria sp. TE3]|uniref:ROK family protein n=1 Tax=Kushneria sp. TE3 TaxID=3449832 RepID=UPI003F684C38